MGRRGCDSVLGILKHFEKWANFKKGRPEDLLCFEIVSNIRQLILKNQFDGVFFHVENETGYKRTASQNLIAKVMGKIPGAPDYVFMRRGHGIAIEIKTKTGKMSKNQKVFKEWCDETCVPYYVCKSWEEVKDVITAHGYIR